jgi:hypothetical protein
MPRLHPIVHISAFPENEREHAFSLIGQFAALSQYTHGFEYALQLFDYSENELSRLRTPRPVMEDSDARFKFMGWMQIAARDATMSLYHFAKAMEEIRDSFRYLPTFRPFVRHDIIRISAKLFAAHFPNYLKMRHSVAHAAEFGSLEERKRNAAGAISMRETLIGRKFTSSIEGRFLSTDMSDRSLNRLLDVEARFFSAFAEAGGFIKDLSRFGP